MKVQNIWRHYCTITKHRRLVRRHCFKIGLYWQGLTHDLSKYSPEEFWTGVRYYQGDRSPNAAEREDVGYSRAWLHHKGRNKHHYERPAKFIKERTIPARPRLNIMNIQKSISPSIQGQGRCWKSCSSC